MTDYKSQIQEDQYAYPYHHLPYKEKGVQFCGRGMQWGYEYLALLDAVIELAMESKPKRIIDFGCGDGRLAIELFEHGCLEVIGVDSSKKARLFAHAFNCDYNFRSYESLDSIPDNDFDTVVAMEVLEHIPNEMIQSVIKNLTEKLKSNGCLIISVPTTNIPVSKKHYRHYDLSILKKQLGERFELEKAVWVHNSGFIASLIQPFIVNRLFFTKSKIILYWVTWAYNIWVKRSSPNKAHRLVTKFIFR